MDAGIRELEQIAKGIVGACIVVHSELGTGLLESTYQACLAHELAERGFLVEREVALPVSYRGLTVEAGYRIDMLVEGKIIIESKVVQNLHPIHEAQLLTYLKLSGRQLGFLVNWNAPRIRQGMKRMIYHHQDYSPRTPPS